MSYETPSARLIEIHGRDNGCGWRCGSHTCTSECKAVIHHGPGHQSSTHCDVDGPHTTHHAIYGEFEEEAAWTAVEMFSE